MSVTPFGRGAARNGGAPVPNLPDPPDQLSDSAREIWDQLADRVPAGNLTAANAHMFGMLCTSIATFYEADRLVQDAGILTVAGQDLIASPALPIRVQADAMTARWAKTFGLTPDARPAQAPAQGIRRLSE